MTSVRDMSTRGCEWRISGILYEARLTSRKVPGQPPPGSPIRRYSILHVTIPLPVRSAQRGPACCRCDSGVLSESGLACCEGWRWICESIHRTIGRCGACWNECGGGDFADLSEL